MRPADFDFHTAILEPRAPGPSPWQSCACGTRWRRLRFDVIEPCPECGQRGILEDAAHQGGNPDTPLTSTTQGLTAAAPATTSLPRPRLPLHNSNETSYAPSLAADAQPVTTQPR